MNKTLLLVSLVAGVSLILLACSSGAAPKEVSLHASDSGKEVRVALNGTVTVTLEANATTGFQWQLTGNSNPGVVTADYRYQPAQQPATGAGGKDVWTFQALRAGKSTLSLEYSQPWPGGTKAAKKFSLTVAVE